MDTSELQKLREHLDEIYVQQKECNERQEEVNNKLANDDKRLELISRDVEEIRDGIASFKKVIWGGLGALITQVIIMIFNMIQK